MATVFESLGHECPEQARLLGCARDALLFLCSTGQPYRFEDYRKRPELHESSRGLAETTEELVCRTEGFFEKIHGELQSEQERALALVIIDALRFIASAGQLDDFKSYLQELDANAPPRVVASFSPV